MNADTILGISPGARFIGIAVVYERTLVHSQVRSFQGVWSDAKLHSILKLIENVMQRYGVTAVSVKVPDVLPLTKGFHQLIGTINALCDGKGIHPGYYSLSEIISVHCKDKSQTRGMLMEAMVEKHPELILEHRREQENSNGYYYKIFEAVAVAHMTSNRLF